MDAFDDSRGGLCRQRRWGPPARAGWAAGLLALGAWTCSAAVTRTQEVDLHPGWNAVFLEVQPAASKPAEIFGALPVEVVAVYLPGSAAETYLQAPGDAPWKEEGWCAWYAASTPTAFLSNLRTIQAGRSYLIRATSGARLTVTGEAVTIRPTWAARTCTFTGLPVAADATTTFAEFFAGSPAHQSLRVYRLLEGRWRRIERPAETAIQAGEAYWIQTDGASRYPGPLQVSLPASGRLDFGGQGMRAVLTLENLGRDSARPRLEVHGGEGAIGLRYAVRSPGMMAAKSQPLPESVTLPVLAAGATLELTLEPERRGVSTEASNLIRLTDGRGWELWVPVLARGEAPVTTAALAEGGRP